MAYVLRSLSPLAECSTDPALIRVLQPILTAFTSAQRPLIITGAGLSTQSGIPDYRSPNRPIYKPLNHNDFVSQPSVRNRYWARSFLGYDLMANASPNPGHLAIARLQAAGLISLITQNVDRLHHRALASLRLSKEEPAIASSPIIELHGTIHNVICLTCSAMITRAALQKILTTENGSWRELWLAKAAPRPDGDVELPLQSYESFTVPACTACGSAMLKPDVVFHGGTLPVAVRATASATASKADFVLLAGTTVSTFSAFRLVRDAAARGIRVGIINFGETRADELLSGPEWKVEAHTSTCLGLLADSLLQNKSATLS
jgi:NAD-dependent deacetylase sirtuin 4